ncbi:MAG TPA: adenylate/guanylate cyclase domain-containing protein [Candidatus Ozemobacteraceae bacterium]|nr:adenylate/guanylate cyclase domain-containing protein [Candidatus Ozemobacteraceae bacterium]
MSLRRFELDRDAGTRGMMIILAWLVFLALPAIGLRSAVFLWLQNEEAGLRSTVRRQMLEEMRLFRDDLQIPHALDALCRPVLAAHGCSENGSPASAAALMQAGPEEFDRLCRDLRTRTASRPSVCALLIPSRKALFLRIDPATFPGKRPAEVERDLRVILEPLMTLRASLDRYTPGEQKTLDRSRQVSEKLFGGDFHLAASLRGVRTDVAHYCGTGNVFCLVDWADVAGPRPQYVARDAALFLALFHDRFVDRAHLLPVPLAATVHSSLRRRIALAGTRDLPRFVRAGEALAIQDVPPFEWPDALLWRSLRKRPSSGLRPVLAVTADAAAFRHPWRAKLPLFDLVLFLSVAVSALICFRAAWFGESPGTGLRHRIAWGFAFGAVIPCIGLALLGVASAKTGETRLPRAVLAHLSRQMHRLDDALRMARIIRARTLQNHADRLARIGSRQRDLVERELETVIRRRLTRSILTFFADGTDAARSSYGARESDAGLRHIMRGIVQDSLQKLGGADSAKAAGEGRNIQASIDIARSITAEYLDDAYIDDLLTHAPGVIGNPFATEHQFMGVQVSPPLGSGRPPAMMNVIWGGWDTISNDCFHHLKSRSRPDFAERRSQWNITYYLYNIESVDPPRLAWNELSADQDGWSRYRRLADVCLRQSLGREYDGLPDEPETLAVSKSFAYGNVVGVAVAVPNGRDAGPGWGGAAAAIVTAWLVVTMATAFFLTLPFPPFLEATRLTARGEYGWHLAVRRADEFGRLADVFNGIARGLRERAGMARFVSEGVLTAVRAADTGTAGMTGGGERVGAAVLCSDIRGFTTLSESHEPEQVVTLLNGYFTLMEEPISAEGGSIESYLGDAIVAVFPARPGFEEPEIRAVRAAFGMRAALERFNARRRAEEAFPIETGIGIAAGTLLWGRLGGEDGRLLPALIGDPADRAPRYEAATKGRGGSGILVDARVRERLGERFPGGEIDHEGETLYLLDRPR